MLKFAFYIALALISAFGYAQESNSAKTPGYKIYPLVKEVESNLPSSLWEQIYDSLRLAIKNNAVPVAYANDKYAWGNYLYNKKFTVKADTVYCLNQVQYARTMEREHQILGVSLQYDTDQTVEEQGEALLDGDYVMFYQSFYSSKSSGFVDNQPFAYFTVKNSKFNGAAYFLAPDGDTLIKGFFLDGLKQGVWNYKIPFNKEFRRFDAWRETNMDFCSYTLNYEKGMNDGLFLYEEAGILRAEGQVKNQNPIGHWLVYYENGQLANDCYLAENKLVVTDYIFKAISGKNYQLPFGNWQMYIPGFGGQPKGENIETYGELSQAEYYILFDKEFKAYYPDGSLMCAWEFSNGKIIKGMETYHPNGKPMFVWKIRKNGKSGILIRYDDNGIRISSRKLKKGDHY